MIVRGPMDMVLDRNGVCDVCGKALQSGNEIFVGRVNGHMIHACSKACFDTYVQKGVDAGQDVKPSD